MKIRINKYLSECGIGSRRKVEEFILDGRVEINDRAVIELSTLVDVERDVVTIDGEKIRPKRHLYYLLHKPKGVVTTTDDERNRETVIDLIKTNEKIFPVGRLDYNTTGALFLTNDGEFSHFLTHPSNHIVKEYIVKLSSPFDFNDKNKLLHGIILDGRNSKFQQLKVMDKTNHLISVKTVEGRNHFVKRMFGRLGYTVVELHRKSIAGFTADGIPPGKYLIIDPAKIKNLMHQDDE